MTGFINIWRDRSGAEWPELHATLDDAVKDAAESPYPMLLGGGHATYVRTYDLSKATSISLSDEAEAHNRAVAEEERWFRNQVPSYAGSVVTGRG